MTPAIRTELENLSEFCIWLGLGGVASCIESGLRGRDYELLIAEFAVSDIRHALAAAVPHNRTAFELLMRLENRLHELRAEMRRTA